MAEILVNIAVPGRGSIQIGNGGSSGNQALFDTLTALQWVHENATTMGGDPDSILVFGESAGASSTCALLASPLAEGLFSAAMIQSVNCGFLEWPLRELSGTEYTFSAEDYGAYMASELDCYGSDTLECMREINADDIMDAFALYSFSPNVDQVFLTRPAREAFLDGDFNQVPVFAGFNENEGVTFTGDIVVETEEDLRTILTSYATDYGFSDADPLIDTYTSDTFGTPKQAFDAFYGDLIFACPTRSFLQTVSNHVDTRAYFFTEAPDWLAYYPDIKDWGAFHFAEIAFVFGTTLEYYTAPEQALSQIMQQAWVSTLDTPTVEGIGEWPLFGEGGGVSENGGTFVQFDSSVTEVTEAVFQDRCDMLDALGWQNY